MSLPRLKHLIKLLGQIDIKKYLSRELIYIYAFIASLCF